MPQKLYEFKLSRFDAAWPPQQGSRLWLEDTIVIDANWDLWVCTQTGAPGTWKKLSGGSVASSYVAEDLTTQIDGQTNTFVTTAARQPGTIRVFLNGQDKGTPGSIQTGAEVEEVDPTTFKLDLVPQKLNGVTEKLHVTYFV